MKQQTLTRRQLLRLAAAGLASTVLLACQAAIPGSPTGPAGTPGEAPTEALRTVLRNINRAHYNVRFIDFTPALEHESYRLQIEGIAQGPASLTLAEMVERLPVTRQNSRMVCVEGWSFRADWEGFTLQALLELVQPQANARYVHFRSVDGYYEVLSIEEMLQERVLLAYKMDGEYLSDEHGWPLRVILPPRYGYKGAKSITRITFSDQGGKGYWSTIGPYTVSGDIRVGILDRPQDLPGEVRQTVAGEQSY